MAVSRENTSLMTETANSIVSLGRESGANESWGGKKKDLVEGDNEMVRVEKAARVLQ